MERGIALHGKVDKSIVWLYMPRDVMRYLIYLLTNTDISKPLPQSVSYAFNHPVRSTHAFISCCNVLTSPVMLTINYVNHRVPYMAIIQLDQADWFNTSNFLDDLFSKCAGGQKVH